MGGPYGEHDTGFPPADTRLKEIEQLLRKSSRELSREQWRNLAWELYDRLKQRPS